MKTKKTKVSYQIPFDKEGNMCKYSHDNRIVEWRDPEPFTDFLFFKEFNRGRSAAHAIFEAEKGQHHGDTFVVFLTDLSEMIPHMRVGEIHGKFTFCKRGQNFGVKLIKPLGL